MQELDFFIMTGLPFEKPEKKVEKVKIAIQKKIDDLSKYSGNDELARKQHMLLNNMRDRFIVNDDLSNEYFEFAKLALEMAKNSLRLYAKFLAKKTLTQKMINTHAERTKLSKETVEEVFCEVGLKIFDLKIDNEKLPKFSLQLEKIYSDLQELRKCKDMRPGAPDYTKFQDIFTVIAFANNDLGNTEKYETLSINELLRIIASEKKIVSYQDDPTHPEYQLLKNLKGYIGTVLKQENALNLYEDFKKYKELDVLFSFLKKETPTRLHDSDFADMVIEKIQEKFPEIEMAIAIYNKEARLIKDPYIPETVAFYVKCSSCQQTSEFKDVDEAKRINKCAHCGTALYKACPKCVKLVLASLSYCPECSFFISGTRNFDRYYEAAKSALDRNEFDEAAKQLAEAKLANPHEKRIAPLEQQILTEMRKYEKPVEELKSLIAQKKYQVASVKLLQIKREFPKLNIVSFENEIGIAVKSADTFFSVSKTKSVTERVNACLDILDVFIDYNPAISFLQATPPYPCTKISAIVNAHEEYCTLNWQPSYERGVSFCSVRKEGSVPQSVHDGTILIKDIAETSCRDNSIVPGIVYGYAVFATRLGGISVGIGCTLALSSEVRNLQHKVEGARCQITWELPKNSTGVQIIRKDGNSEKHLGNNAKSSFSDSNLEYGTFYTYIVQAKYLDCPSSAGLKFSIAPTMKIEPFDISYTHKKGNSYTILWKIKLKGLDIKISFNGKGSDVLLKSDVGSYTVTLQPNQFHSIQVFASSGSEWVKAKSDIALNTFAPVRIDMNKGKTGFKNNRLIIKLSEPIPSGVVGFYYSIKTKANSSQSAPWLEKMAIANGDTSVRKLSVSDYQKNGEIVISEIKDNFDDYYCTIYSEYKSGQNLVLSERETKKISRPLDITVEFSVVGSFLSRSQHLEVTFKAKKMIFLPRMVLCFGKNGGYFGSYNDPNAEILIDIPQEELNESVSIAERKYRLSSTKPKNARVELFFPDAPENINYRRKQMI